METCPRGFLCLDNNTLILSLSVIFLLIAYIASINKIEYNKLVDYNDLNKNKEDLLKTYMKTIRNKISIKEALLNPVETIERNIERNIERSTERNIERNIERNTDLDSELSGRDTNLLIKNNNIYVIPPSSNNSMIINKEHERLINPLLPPERSYNTTYSVPINIPTRGLASNYQQVGVITSDTPEGGKILPLFGRPQWKGANRWNFYTSTDQYNSLKLPIYSKKRDCQDQIGCDELYDGDQVFIPQYGENAKFKVTMYKLDSPVYLG
jgi:hypothetical protein